MDQRAMRRIVAQFGVTFRQATSPEHLFLSQVYLLDDAYVLRSRTDKGLEALEEERKFIDAVSENGLFAFPRMLPARDGMYAVEEHGVLWTLYRAIPGEIRGTWQQGSSADHDALKTLFSAQRALHDRTRGTCGKPQVSWYAEKIAGLVHGYAHPMPPVTARLVRSSLQFVLERYDQAPQRNVCFIHGDMHLGNALFTGSACTGLIDCNWAHLGDPYEDFAYSTMNHLRDYASDALTLNEALLSQFIAWYGEETVDRGVLAHYLFLASIFDEVLFSTIATDEGRRYHAYQRGVTHAFSRLLS